MSRSNPRRTWTAEHRTLKPDHGWRTKPGHKIFVADGGAVRFDIPESWVLEPGDDSFCFNDKKPPDDDCRLQVSVMYLTADFDRTGFSLSRCLHEVQKMDTRGLRLHGDVIEERRPAVELAWREAFFFDEIEKRNACARLCFARSTDVQRIVIQSFITMEFWTEHSSRFIPVWDEVLRSLTLGDFVEDPERRILH